MRMTSEMMYQTTTSDYRYNMSELYKTNRQLSSGLKIGDIFDDSDVYSDAIRLDYDIATLTQVTNAATSAQTFTNNSDEALSDMTKVLEDFKVKLIQGAQETNDPTSLDALANDLEVFKDALVSIANSNINGNYLFAGDMTATRPIDPVTGEYKGNDTKIKALIGSGVKAPYNITGKELFLGRDVSYERIISTNMNFMKQSGLHPEIDPLLSIESPVEQIPITMTDSVRELVGDTDNDPNNDPNVVFYTAGRKPNGDTFKTQIEVPTSATIEDVMDLVGKEFGNTAKNKVVDISMTKDGQIEIKDLEDGNSLIEFKMFAAIDRDAAAGTAGNALQNDYDDIANQKNVDILTFNKSAYGSKSTATNVGVTGDPYDKQRFEINSVFEHMVYEYDETTGEYEYKSKDAALKDRVQDVLGNNVNAIRMTGTDSAGNPVARNVAVSGANYTMDDFMRRIEAEFSANPGDIEVSLEYGKMVIHDTTVAKDDPFGTSTFNINLETRDAAGAAYEGLKIEDGMNQDKRMFDKEGSKLKSNISQMVINGSDFATDNTKLSEVAGESLVGKQFEMRFSRVDGSTGNALINFANPNTSFQIDYNDDGDFADLDEGPFDIYGYDGTQTAANDITYRQISDIVSIALSGHPIDSTAIDPVAEYKKVVDNAQSQVSVGLDYKGRLQADDNFNAVTQMELSLFDTDADSAINPVSMSFMSNDAIIVEDSHIDMFADLEEMILAVREGNFRMNDSKTVDPRNMGMQNGIRRLDHILDHVISEHTKIGSYTNSFQDSSDRSTMLSINVQETKSSTVDADLAEAYLTFSKLTNQYQAMLSTISKINDLTMVNYV